MGDNARKKKVSVFLDKAQIEERKDANRRSQQKAARTVKVLTANGKLRKVTTR